MYLCLKYCLSIKMIINIYLKLNDNPNYLLMYSNITYNIATVIQSVGMRYLLNTINMK